MLKSGRFTFAASLLGKERICILERAREEDYSFSTNHCIQFSVDAVRAAITTHRVSTLQSIFRVRVQSTEPVPSKLQEPFSRHHYEFP